MKASLAGLFIPTIKKLILSIFAILSLSPLAKAAGGACPTGANYTSASEAAAMAGTLTTLSSLGVTNCYFVSAAGSDSNSGTSESSPWAHLPGSLICTGNCAALTPAAGTGFIFRGGDTWGASNFGITWKWAGTSSNPVYIGVDKGWYSGSAWGRPIWNTSGNASLNGQLFYGNASYWIVDNIEITGVNFVGSGTTATGAAAFVTCGQYTTVENSYEHGWTWTTPWTYANGPANAAFYEIGEGCDQSSMAGVTSRFNVVDGSDTANPTVAVVSPSGNMPIAYGNYYNYVWSGIDGCGDNWHDNVVNHMGEPINAFYNSGGTYHQNAFKHLSGCQNSTVVNYNNIVSNQYSWGGGSGAVKFWWNGGGTVTTYAWNNIMFNNVSGNNTNTGSQNHASQNNGTLYLFNNSFQCGSDSSLGICAAGSNGQPSSSSMVLNLLNNHWITTTVSSGTFTGAGGVVTQCVSTWTCTSTNDLYQTSSQANTVPQCYNDTGTFAWQPTCGTGATVTNSSSSITSLCSAITSINSYAGSQCGNSTSYAIAYNTTNHTVSFPALTPLSRSNPPNIGAYQYNGTPIVAAPTFSPTAGTYAATQSVTISTTTSGAAILFCQDTTNTCTPSTTYSSAVSVSATGYIRAQATHSGYTSSGVISSAYTIQNGIVGNNASCPTGINDSGNAGYVLMVPGTIPAGSGGYTITGVYVCVISPAAGTWGVAVYSGSPGSASTLICSATSTITPTANVYNELIPSCPTIANGAQITLSQITSSNSQGQAWSSGTCPTGSYPYYINSPLSGPPYTFPNPAGSTTQIANTNCYLEYATIVPATGTSPIASLGPTSESFSTNANTTSASQTATLANASNATGNLVVSATSISALFSATGSGLCAGSPPYTLTPGQSCNFAITFSPTTTGTFTGTFTVTSNATPSTNSIALTGTGTAGCASWSPTSYAFGVTSTSTPKTSTTLVLSNTCNGPTTGSISFSTSYFTSATSTCGTGTITIAAGNSCNYTTTFTPTAATSYSANETWTDSAQSITASIALTGTGATGAAVAQPASSLATNVQYATSQTTTLSDSTGGATICYRQDGGIPTASVEGTCDASSTTYTGAITISSTQTLRYIGTLSGSPNSSVGTSSYVISASVLPPTFSYTGTTLMMTSQTPSAVICYTTNGVPPQTNGAGACTYGGTLANGGSITISVSTIVYAVGTLSPFTDSSPPSTAVILVGGNGVQQPAPVVIFM